VDIKLSNTAIQVVSSGILYFMDSDVTKISLKILDLSTLGRFAAILTYQNLIKSQPCF
jgi:hypothetical protein